MTQRHKHLGTFAIASLLALLLSLPVAAESPDASDGWTAWIGDLWQSIVTQLVGDAEGSGDGPEEIGDAKPPAAADATRPDPDASGSQDEVGGVYDPYG